MFPRRLTQIFLVCLAVSLSAFAQTGSSFLLQLPGSGSGGNRIVGYQAGAADLDADIDTIGPINADRVLATPDGSKFYLLSDGPIQVIDAALQNFTSLNNLVGPYKNAAITPDGKYLVLMGTSLWAQQKPQEATEAFLKSAETVPLSRWGVWGLVRAGNVLDLLGRRAEALQAYARAAAAPDRWGYLEFAKAGQKRPFRLEGAFTVDPP